MIHILILAVCLIVVTILIMCDDRELTFSGVVTCIISLVIIIIGLIQIDKQDQTPTAIDVYRGNTTLEITYRDSVAIDSVVVFK